MRDETHISHERAYLSKRIKALGINPGEFKITGDTAEMDDGV